MGTELGTLLLKVPKYGKRLSPIRVLVLVRIPMLLSLSISRDLKGVELLLGKSVTSRVWLLLMLHA